MNVHVTVNGASTSTIPYVQHVGDSDFISFHDSERMHGILSFYLDDALIYLNYRSMNESQQAKCSEIQDDNNSNRICEYMYIYICI